MKIPENKIGNFEIKYKNGICYLKEGPRFFWMWDAKEDKLSQQFAIDACRGKVLVGGLGLGYIVEELEKKGDVTEIIVVERASEVIELVWKYLNVDKARIIQADIFDYLKETEDSFDYIYLDVWSKLTKAVYETTVLPLRKLAERIVTKDKVLCWQEGYMESLKG